MSLESVSWFELYCKIDTDVIVLADVLGTNKILKNSNLPYNGPRAAIERWMGCNVLRELILDDILSRELAFHFG
jgi:hypothetical protein